MYTNIGDKIIALAKTGFASSNSDKNLMKSIADWARVNTSGWTLSATDPKTGTVDPSWSPVGQDWEDVFSLGNSQINNYLNSLGIYSKADAKKMASDITGGTNPPLISKAPEYSDDVIPVQPSGAAAPMVQPWEQDSNPSEMFLGVSGSQAAAGDTQQNQNQDMYRAVLTQQPIEYDPVADANARFADYQKAVTGAATNAIDAERAYANSIINNGGIWKTLQPEYQKQLDSAISTLTQISAIAKANVAAQKASMDAEQAMNYQNALDDLDRNLVASRQRTTEEMNQRGLFFSTVLDSVMGKVEAASATQRGQLGRQNIVELGKIAAQMAALTANVDIQELQGKAAAMAQYGAAMLQWIAQDEQTKQEMTAILAKLDVQKAGVADAVFAQIFGQGEQMRSTAVQEGFQIEDRANAAQDKAVSDFVSTIEQYSSDYQAKINEIANDGDTSNDWQLPYLKIARGKKIEAQVMALAESNAAAAIAEAKRVVEEGKMSIDWFRAITDRINATGSTTGTTKYEKPGSTKPGGGVWTDPQARTFKENYEKVLNMPIGTAIDSAIAQDPNTVVTGIPLTVGTAWTQEQKDAYLSANKALYDSAMDYINQTTTTMLNPNNQQLHGAIRAVLQGMIDQGVPINMENLKNAIYEGYYIAPKIGDTSSTSGGAEYDFLMQEYNKLLQ